MSNKNEAIPQLIENLCIMQQVVFLLVCRSWGKVRI